MRNFNTASALVGIAMILNYGCRQNTSQKEDCVQFWYGDQQVFFSSACPQEMVNILGNIELPEGVYDATYSLNGKRKFPFPLGPSAYRLAQKGDFNIELDKNRFIYGKNILSVNVTSLKNKFYQKEISFIVNKKPEPVLPCRIDFSQHADIPDAVQIVDGLWTNKLGALRTIEPGYDRAFVIGDTSWTDYQIQVEIILHGLVESDLAKGYPSNGSAIHIGCRWLGHSDWNDILPRRGWDNFSALFSYKPTSEGSFLRIWTKGKDKYDMTGTVPFQMAFNKPYVFKAGLRTMDNHTKYFLKVWDKSSPEPDQWQIIKSGLPGENDHGSIILVAHQLDASFGKIVVE